jgi:thioredoxin reductase (NADPH)
MNYQLVVIGSGPAGLTAAIYASRAKLKTLVIEGTQPGGQLMTTTNVENWPGNVSIPGPELMINMRSHAEACGAELLMESVVSVETTSRPFVVRTDSGKKIMADTVIVCTGATSKRLGCPGEQEYWAKGVSTCATCDAPFFEGKDIVIVGGGNTAVTEAEHLTHFAKSVTIVHILDALTANDPIKDKVLSHPKVTFRYTSTVVEITGDENHVTGVVLEHQKTKERTTLATQGVFIAIGFNPNTSLFKDKLAMDAYGYLTLTGHTKTSVPGIFAAGDVADYRYRQAITSAGVGCMAALDCQAFLASEEK